MSKSMIPESRPGVRCQYLLHQWDRMPEGHLFPLHSHDCWHLDTHEQGDTELWAGGEVYRIRAGDLYGIPAGLEHHWRHDRATRCLTMKLMVRGVKVPEKSRVHIVRPKARSWLGRVRQAFLGYMPRDRHLNAAEQPVFNHLAETVFAHLYPADAGADEDPAWLRAVYEAVDEAGGRPLSVADLAARVHYSVSHLSARFRQHTDEALKTYLDRQRAACAARHLRYSDQSISEVGRTLGFHDVYTFSRFFKRVTGQSPRVFRKDGAAYL